MLLLGDSRLRHSLALQDSALLADLGWRVVSLAPRPGQDQVVDVTGAYAAWLADLGGVAVLVRPDLYVYGVATDSTDLQELMRHLRRALGAVARTSDPGSALHNAEPHDQGAVHAAMATSQTEGCRS